METYNKLRSLALFFFLLSQTALIGQCPTGDVTIFSQQSVTDFVGAYPNCTIITGNLIIDDSSDVVGGVYTADITSLVGLEKIKTVTAGLRIENCSQLSSFIGLDNLESVGTDVYIVDNNHSGLDDFSGLGMLTTVSNSITIRFNNNLEDIYGLGTISGALTGQIKITDNPILSDITPLNGITSTGSDVTVKRNNLSDLAGLASIQTIGGFLGVGEEPLLTDISALLGLTSIGNNTLSIYDNPLLTSLDGLDDIMSINGSLYLSNNADLGDCDAVCHILVNNLATSYSVGGNKMGSTCQYTTALQTHCGVPLPIELMNFESRHDASKVYLNWETATEINNAGQYVEKSQDGRDWQELAWIDGYGTTQELHTYQFDDETPFEGINYYRLKQVDHDGTITFSEVISEYFSRKGSSAVKLYPNPANQQLYVQHQATGAVEAQLFDMYGKSVLVSDLSHSIDLSGLSEGVYYIKVYEDAQILDWQKVVILR